MVTPSSRERQAHAPLHHRDDQGGSEELAGWRDRDAAPGLHALPAHRDLVRWGPVWAGVMVTFASFLAMQLAIFAADLFDEGGGAATWLTVAAAALAFFLGGMAAGAGALWQKMTDGLFNGVVLWAVATVGLLLLALVGGGTLLGPISTVASDLGQIQDLNLQNVPTDQIDSALADARTAAGWALLGLMLSLVATATGGAVGAKLWPGRDRAATPAGDPDRAGLR